MATGKHSKEERRPPSAAACDDQMHVKRKEAAEGFGVSSAAPLISLKAFIVSALDEPLMRSFTGGEKKARGNGSLLGGGVDEIITQLS